MLNRVLRKRKGLLMNKALWINIFLMTNLVNGMNEKKLIKPEIKKENAVSENQQGSFKLEFPDNFFSGEGEGAFPMEHEKCCCCCKREAFVNCLIKFCTCCCVNKKQ